MVLNTTFYACFHVRVALLKCDFLRVPCTESWTSWAQMKAENLRNSKMVLHVPIAASKLELLASKRNRAFHYVRFQVFGRLQEPTSFCHDINHLKVPKAVYTFHRRCSLSEKVRSRCLVKPKSKSLSLTSYQKSPYRSMI